MKRLFVLMLILASGCQKKDGKSHDVSSMPGASSTVITQYNGTLNGAMTQSVQINTDPVEYPNDAVYAYVCRGVDCTADNLPAQECSAIYPDMTTPCYRTTPCQLIAFGTNLVSFVQNAKQAGYQSYAIKTVVTR